MSRLFRTARAAARGIAQRLTGRPPAASSGSTRRSVSRRSTSRNVPPPPPPPPDESLGERIARILLGRRRSEPEIAPGTAPPVDLAWRDYQRRLAQLPDDPGRTGVDPQAPGQTPQPPTAPQPPSMPEPPRVPQPPITPQRPAEPTTPEVPPPGRPPGPPTGQPPELEEPPEDQGGRGAPYRLEDWQRVMLEMRLTPGSSNVYGYYFELESRTRGILYVTFLGTTRGGERSGAGQTYAYYDVPARKYHEFAKMASETAGGAVWDYLRVRGTHYGHQHTYRLIHSHGVYVPRKATPEGFRSRAVTSKGTGRRSFRRSTLPERLFTAREDRRGRPDRGRPNRGEPDRGDPNRGEPDRGN